jgi:hypothetical protein
MKEDDVMAKPKTHFEQVSLEQVKKAVEAESDKTKITRGEKSIIESPVKKTEPYSISSRSL